MAIASEIRKVEPDAVIVFVGFKGDKKMHKALIRDKYFTRTYVISAGKFRRYHGVSWWRQLLDIPTMFKNIRDFFRTISGTFAAVRILRKERPDAVFAKGGFIGVPIGLAAKITNTPLVTHDSDTLAGLANRMVSRWASYIATGAPAEFYDYPKSKVVEVGVPVPNDVSAVAKLARTEVRDEMELPQKTPVTIVFGGTHGGKEINEAVLATLDDLARESFIVHVAGASNYQDVTDSIEGRRLPKNYRLLEFVQHTQLMKYFKAADVVVARVGATAMAEMAILGPAAILVPNPKLTGGHQIKNAKRYSKAEAAVVIDQSALEKQPEIILESLKMVLADNKMRKKLVKNLTALAKPNATSDLARLVMKAGNRGEVRE